MDGLCDVNGCTGETYMGWRPLTERLGRQVCEYHWRRHRDEQDSFDLFEAFGFKRPAGLPKPAVRRDAPACASGTGQKQQQYAEQTSPRAQPLKGPQSRRCRACPAQRQPRHTYCQRCGAQRQRKANQQRQRRYRERHARTAVA
jgi:hypothetical protein